MTNRREKLLPTTLVEKDAMVVTDKEEEEEEKSLLPIYVPEGKESNLQPQSSSSSSRRHMVYIYMIIFFGAMIGMEIALEAASKHFGGLDSLAAAATCFQFSFCVLFPLILSKGKGLENLPKTRQEVLPYIRLSCLVFGATALATQSVRYVTYPTKVIFKSAKLIPTMVVATVWQNQRYSRMEYLAAIFLCLGAAGFGYSNTNNDKESTYPTGAIWGIFLLLISITCDAVVPNYQKTLLNQGVSAGQLMININTVGTGAVLTYMLVTGQLVEVIATCYQHPLLLFYLACVGSGLATAVWAYTKLIQATSSVVAVAVSTLRKVGTICLSYILFPKPILPLHTYSGLLVLLGMILSSYAKEQEHRPKR